MKKGLTLIEMMVVVLIIAVLMSIMFRIGNIGTESEAKIVTILRLQRLENCLSGYNACFGTYPPVPVQGSRNINAKVSDHGVQVAGSESLGGTVWAASDKDFDTQVEAACKAQPVDIMFPWSKKKAATGGYVDQIGDEMSHRSLSRAEEWTPYWFDENRRRILDANFDAGTRNDSTERFNKIRDQYDWRHIQVFKFGLLSFILPRFLVMMNANEDFYNFKQWTANNTVPCNPFTGENFGSWQQVRACAESGEWADTPGASEDNWTSRAKLSAIPSQAACARWIPNLEGIVRTNLEAEDDVTVYGIMIADDPPKKGAAIEKPNRRFHVGNYTIASDSSRYEGTIFTPAEPNPNPGMDSTKDQYCLDRMTIVDGWGRTFFYYSPSPYQTYQMWSSGQNGQTFPPWISLKKLSSAQNQRVAPRVKDDIIRLSK